MDHRLPIDTDPALGRHAARCPRCQLDYSVGLQIQAHDVALPAEPSKNRRRRVVVASVAALLGFFVIGFWPPGGPDTTPRPAPEAIASADRPGGPTDGPTPSDLLAWTEIDPSDWVGRTMPAVRSVRRSVAPVGRSFLKAVVLLTSATVGETT